MVEFNYSMSLNMLLYGLIVFLVLLLLFMRYLAYSRSESSANSATSTPDRDRLNPIGYTAFSRGLVAVSCLAWLCDWPIQLPLLLSLLASQGYGQADHFLLTSAFLGSAIVFGLLFGALADRYGRKLACVLFYLCPMISYLCFMLSHTFAVTLTATIFLGTAVGLGSYLFESVYVNEHHQLRNYSVDLLPSLFKLCHYWSILSKIPTLFVCSFLLVSMNSMIPVLAMLLCLLAMSLPFVLLLVTESYNLVESNKDSSKASCQAFRFVFRALRDVWVLDECKYSLILLALMQGFFESSAMIFFIGWDKLLSEHFIEFMFIGNNVFSYPVIMITIFLLSMALGCDVFTCDSSLPLQSVLPIFKFNAIIAASSLFFIGTITTTNSWAKYFVIGQFVFFAMSFGIYLPCIAVIRALYIPENYRSTLTSLLRFPVYLMMLLLLHGLAGVPWEHLFLLGSAWLLLSAVLAHSLQYLARHVSETNVGANKGAMTVLGSKLSAL